VIAFSGFAQRWDWDVGLNSLADRPSNTYEAGNV